jgi:hypothetical protein
VRRFQLVNNEFNFQVYRKAGFRLNYPYDLNKFWVTPNRLFSDRQQSMNITPNDSMQKEKISRHQF